MSDNNKLTRVKNSIGHERARRRLLARGIRIEALEARRAPASPADILLSLLGMEITGELPHC